MINGLNCGFLGYRAYGSYTEGGNGFFDVYVGSVERIDCSDLLALVDFACKTDPAYSTIYVYNAGDKEASLVYQKAVREWRLINNKRSCSVEVKKIYHDNK